MFEALESTLSYAMSAAVIGVVVFYIANRFRPQIKGKVGPAYWGVYDGAALVEDAGMRVLDLQGRSKRTD